MKPKAVATQRIGNHMHAIEDGLDSVLARISEAITDVSTARVDYGVDANEMQRVLARLVAGQTAVIQARTKAIGAHSDLRKFAEPKSDYPIFCPDDGRTSGQEGPLKVVA